MRLQNTARDALETLAVFIDFHNLEGSLRNEGYETDLIALRDYLAESRRLLETFVYVGFNPNNLQEDERRNRRLQANGFFVRTKPAKIKPDGSLKCDLDIEMVLDVVDYASQVGPEIILLVTGDGDFTPLLGWLRIRGTRVEVASTPNSISKELREAANGYIDLCEAIEEMKWTGETTVLEGKEVTEDGHGDHQRPADATA